VTSADLEALTSIASECTDAQLVVLFGSVSRDAPMPWSDVDVAVLGVEFWRGLELGSRIGALLHREPHVVDLAAASSWLRYLVAKDGVLLHEDGPGLWHRFRANAFVQWFDVQPIVALCAEGARRALQGAPRIG
jgi:predicted nucleotidyltransferase